MFKPNQFLDTSIDATLNNTSFSIDPQQEIFRLKQIIKIQQISYNLQYKHFIHELHHIEHKCGSHILDFTESTKNYDLGTLKNLDELEQQIRNLRAYLKN